MRKVTRASRHRLVPAPFRSNVLPAQGRGVGIERGGMLDEYTAELVVRDAIWVGRGANLVLQFGSIGARDNAVWVRELAIRLARYGVSVSVSLDRREEGLYAAGPY